ncbi:MAG: class I SAM-dependent methyltransferase [Duodenibacillus sp.]|nr:class I SAM-dependent methyltransferase [Duodenibacillus sp.]
MAADVSCERDPPSAWLARFAPLIDRPGLRVLEVACGNGRNTRLLARLACAVTAVDIRPMPEVPAGVRFELRDLEGAPWPYAPASFDCAAVINYLWRPRLPELLASVAPGGLLLYETFTAEQAARFGKPASPAHWLAHGELLERLGEGWRVLAYEDGRTDAGRWVERVAARRLAGGAACEEDFGLCAPR